MTKKELNEVLDKHKKWLINEDGGKRANLSGAYLSGADLSRANLSRANLSGAYLYGADLSRANLSRANLSGANLSGANLYGANLSGADLSGAYLYGANLSGANLSGANLSRANLSRANLSGAYLSGAKGIETSVLNRFFPICCPEFGSFIGWKQASGKIVKLQITDDAKRSSAFGRKCRCSKAVVLAIENEDGSPAEEIAVQSYKDSHFIYEIGKTVEVADFCEDRKIECAPGIHFFITRQEAVDYVY